MAFGDPAERRALKKLVRRHKGNISAMAEALGKTGRQISRQALTQRIIRYGLHEEAETLRAQHYCPGPKPRFPGGSVDPLAEQHRIEAAIAVSTTREDLCKRLAMSRRTLYRKLTIYRLLEQPKRDAV